MHTRERVEREGVVEKDVVTVCPPPHRPQREVTAIILQSLRRRTRRQRQQRARRERRRRKTRRNHQVGRGRWVQKAARVVEGLGLVGKRLEIGMPRGSGGF